MILDLLHAYRKHRSRQRLLEVLSGLTDRQLSDIGVSRESVGQLTSRIDPASLAAVLGATTH